MCYNGHKQSKGETLVIPFPEYPRPALRRDSFLNLNGSWSYAITADEALPHAWDGEILVPYSPEAALSVHVYAAGWGWRARAAAFRRGGQ